VSDNDVPRGQARVDAAALREKEAHDAFDRGKLREAQRLTRDARAQLLEVSARLRGRDEATDAVGEQIALTDRLLKDEQDRLERSPNTPTGQRFETARGIQERARRVYDEGRLRPALQLTLQAREMMQRVAGGRERSGPRGREWSGPPIREERLARVIDRQDRAISRLAGHIDPSNQRAREQLELARSSHAAARTAMHDEHWALAEQYVRQAQQALLLAGVGAARDLRADDVAALIEDASHRQEELAGPVRESGSADLDRRLKQAGDDLAEAKVALAAGQARQALAQTRSALSIMDEISEELGR